MRRIKYSNLMIIGIFIYIIFQVVLLIVGKNTSTLVLESEKIEEKITTQGIFIREEYLIKSDASGKVDLKIEDGEKIKKDQVVAYVYKNSNEVENNNKEIESINNDLTKISNMEDSKSKSILSTQEKTKKQQKEILENQNKKNTTTINATESGIISYKYDGNEERYNLDILNNLTEDDIKNAGNSYKTLNNNDLNIKEGQPLGRIISNYSTYIGVCLTEKEAKKFEVDQNVKINIDGNIIDAKIDRSYQNYKEVVIILKITNQNVEIYDTRTKEFDIIYKQIEGLKIPKSCIQIVDNRQGAYVVNQQTKKADFVELKGVQYENDDFVFIDYYKNEIDGIKTVKLYDEIILKPNSINKNIKMK